MSVILITANFKFRNRSTCSKEPMKRAGKVCGDSQDLKSPGMFWKLPGLDISNMNFLIADVIWFVSGTMITFSQGGAAKNKSKQFSEFGFRTTGSYKLFWQSKAKPSCLNRVT